MSVSGRFYFRSENLDSIVYLLHQASSQEDAAAFAVREKRHFELLRKYGIDPLQSAGSDADDESEGIYHIYICVCV